MYTINVSEDFCGSSGPIRKNIFARLFSLYNTKSLSRHEQAFNFQDMINLLYHFFLIVLKTLQF